MTQHNLTFFKEGDFLRKELAKVSLQDFAKRIDEFRNLIHKLEDQIAALNANYKNLTNFIEEQKNQRIRLEAQLKEKTNDDLIKQIQQIDVDIDYLNVAVKRHHEELPQLEAVLKNCQQSLLEKEQQLAAQKATK